MCVEQLSVEEMYNNCCEEIDPDEEYDSDWEDYTAEILKALEAAGLTFGGTRGQMNQLKLSQLRNLTVHTYPKANGCESIVNESIQKLDL